MFSATMTVVKATPSPCIDVSVRLGRLFVILPLRELTRRRRIEEQ